jgi:hypothetical protein
MLQPCDEVVDLPEPPFRADARQLCGRDRYRRLIEVEALRLADRTVQRQGDNAARINRFLNQEKPPEIRPRA